MTDLVERLRACRGIQSGDPDCCCQEAAAEIAQLRAAIAWTRGVCTEIGRLKAENAGLRAALAYYGDHTYECELKNEGKCSCGYDVALEQEP